MKSNELDILKPDGSLYTKVSITDKTIVFSDFSDYNISVHMDIKILDQLIPFLNDYYDKNQLQ